MNLPCVIAMIGLAVLCGSGCAGAEPVAAPTAPALRADVSDFMSALSEGQRACVTAAFGREALPTTLQLAIEQTQMGDLDTDELQTLSRCTAGPAFQRALGRAVMGSILEGTAPEGLGEAILPEGAREIAGLIGRLPDRIGGRTQSPGPVPEGAPRMDIAYGQRGEIRFRAMDVSTGDFYPEDWTAGDTIAFFTLGADWDVIGFGRQEALMWVRSTTTAGGSGTSETTAVHTLMWGNADGRWVFAAIAYSADDVDRMARAFAEAATSP